MKYVFALGIFLGGFLDSALPMLVGRLDESTLAATVLIFIPLSLLGAAGFGLGARLARRGSSLAKPGGKAFAITVGGSLLQLPLLLAAATLKESAPGAMAVAILAFPPLAGAVCGAWQARLRRPADSPRQPDFEATQPICVTATASVPRTHFAPLTWALGAVALAWRYKGMLALYAAIALLLSTGFDAAITRAMLHSSFRFWPLAIPLSWAGALLVLAFFGVLSVRGIAGREAGGEDVGSAVTPGLALRRGVSTLIVSIIFGLMLAGAVLYLFALVARGVAPAIADLDLSLQLAYLSVVSGTQAVYVLPLALILLPPVLLMFWLASATAFGTVATQPRTVLASYLDSLRKLWKLRYRAILPAYGMIILCLILAFVVSLPLGLLQDDEATRDTRIMKSLLELATGQLSAPNGKAVLRMALEAMVGLINLMWMAAYTFILTRELSPPQDKP